MANQYPPPPGYGPPPSGGYGPPPPGQWAPPPKPRNWLAIIGISLLVVLVLGFGGCAVCIGVVGSAAKKETTSRKAKASRGADDERNARTAAKTVKIETLLADYKSNEVRADELYRGKMVQTKGKVRAISKGIGDGVYIVLEPTNGGMGLESVHCTPTSEAAGRAGQLKKGQSLTVGGKVRGYLMLSVMIDDCEW